MTARSRALGLLRPPRPRLSTTLTYLRAVVARGAGGAGALRGRRVPAVAQAAGHTLARPRAAPPAAAAATAAGRGRGAGAAAEGGPGDVPSLRARPVAAGQRHAQGQRQAQVQVVAVLHLQSERDGARR